tara:strand:- start:2435 stop:3262 length:828 start_codon:yes stop_codon:yes gene_type:complete
MTDDAPLRIERGEAIDWIVFDRPDVANALSSELLEEFSKALTSLAAHGAPVIGIRGAGKGFSAGIDLGQYNAKSTPLQDVMRLRRNIERWLEIWKCRKPVIVAIHGFCMGIAAQIPVFADIVIVADDARISEPGLPLGGGYIAPTWVNQVGSKRAKEFAFLPGNFIDGLTAEKWGLANAAVPAENLITCVTEMAARMALVPAEVLMVKKQSINRAMEAAGFLTAINAVAESDAILHLEPSVQKLRSRISNEGLKAVLSDYRGTSSTEIFDKHRRK